jgi:hypothetical protein
MNFLVVVKIPVPTTLVDSLVMLSRFSLVLRSAVSWEQQEEYSFHKK